MTQLVDVYGNPLQRETLNEQQTAHIANLQQTYALHPSRGLTPPRLAAILENAERGDMIAQHDLFLDMEEKDAHLYAEIGKRKRAMLTVDWSVEPPRNASSKEKKAAAYVEELLRSLPNFDDVILDAVDAIGHGFSCQELTWQREGSEWIISGADHRPQSWFRLDRETRSQLRLRDNSVDGAELNPFGWLTHIHKAKSGYLSRAGLYRVLAWPYLFKNYGIRDFAELLEIYGLPLRVGKYPTSATADEKATLLRAVLGIGHDAGGIIPEGMLIEFEQAAAGNDTPFVAMIAWAEKSISKAILGGTLTSQADGKTSTNALGNVHNEVRRDLLMGDAVQLGGTLTRDLVWPLLVVNGRQPDSLRRCPRLVFDASESADLTLYADALPKLVGVGMRIPLEGIHAKLRIPMAADGEEVLTIPKPPTPNNPQNPDEPAPADDAIAANTALAAATATQASRSGAAQADAADLLLPNLRSQANPALGGIVESIRALVEQAESPQALQAALVKAYGDLDTAELTKVMALAFACAELAGLAEVKDAS